MVCCSQKAAVQPAELAVCPSLDIPLHSHGSVSVPNLETTKERQTGQRSTGHLHTTIDSKRLMVSSILRTEIPNRRSTRNHCPMACNTTEHPEILQDIKDRRAHAHTISPLGQLRSSPELLDYGLESLTDEKGILHLSDPISAQFSSSSSRSEKEG